MAGSKVLAPAVLLAAAALLTTTATAVDDEHMYHWKCFTSCNTRCHDNEDNAAVKVDGVGHRCKKGCLNECFENFPALCYQQCVVSTCLCKPPYSKEKIECMKTCCDKCFHHGPAPPMPPKPMPPKPPSPPKPSPPVPSPPKPSPPVPSPPKPSPPMPSPPKPSPPKPSPPKPPRPPCPPGGEKAMGNIKN